MANIPPEISSTVFQIVKKHIGNTPYRLFYFGSRVKNNKTDHSDIDIGIEADQPLPYEVIGKIKEDLSNLPTLYSIDLVDFKRVSDDFRKVALRDIIEIKVNSL